MKKIIKKILLAVLLIVVFVLIVALFLPKNFKAETSTTINLPLKTVFNYAVLIGNQNKYGTWVKSDPNVKIQTTGIDGTLGFKSCWDGKITGKGCQTIVKIDTFTNFTTRLDFDGQGGADANMTFESINATNTKVTWTCSGKMPYPFNFFITLTGMNDILKKEFQTGLDNMKSILESNSN